MTNLITLTIPNDDHIALRAFGKALEEMALAHGAEPSHSVSKVNIDGSQGTAALNRLTFSSHLHRVEPEVDTTAALERLNTATGELMKAAPRMMQEARFDGEELQGKRKEAEVDTTAQEVESLAEREIKVTEQMVKFPIMNHPMDTPHVDKTGTPWDERIHSASKALNADGTWRLRRKPKDMDEAEWATLVESVKLELSGATASGNENELQPPLYEVSPGHIGVMENLCIDEGCDHHGTPHICITPEPPVTPPGDDFHTDAGVVTEQTVASIPPIPVPPPVVVPPVTVDDAWTFPKLMTFLTERQGKIDVATVNMLLAQDGIVSLPELNAHPDKIGPFVARVKAHLGE